MTRNTHHPPHNSDTTGLTLIELVAAMAVFAMVAVMGLQALTGTLRMRDRLGARADQAAALSLGLTQLRHDLSAMLPLVFHAPGGGQQSALALSPDGRTLAFSIGGQPDLPPISGQGLHRVEWRFDPARGQLWRRVWPVLQPASPSAAFPEVLMLGPATGSSPNRVTGQLTGLTLRSFWPDQGWRPGVSSGLPDVAPAPGAGDSDNPLVLVANSYSDTLPDAIEITLRIDGLGPVTLVETLR